MRHPFIPPAKRRRIPSTRPVTILDTPPADGGWEYRAAWCGIPLQVFSQRPVSGDLLQAGDTIIARRVPGAGELWFPSPELIAAICDRFEFDPVDGQDPEIIHVSGEVYAVVYQGPDLDGWLITVQIKADGTIIGIIASFEFDPVLGLVPEIIHISGEVYAIVYRGPGFQGWLQTVNIQADGTIGGTIDSLLFYPHGDYSYSRIIHISGETYATVFRGVDVFFGASTGVLQTINIQADGTIGGVIDSLEFQSWIIYDISPRIIHISGETYAIAYQGADGDGWLKTVGIQADGTIVGIIDSFEFDAAYGAEPYLVHISGEVYAIAYTGPDDDGWLQTVNIQADGTIGGTIDSLEFDAAFADDVNVLHISGEVYTIIYRHGSEKTVNIQADGTIGGIIDFVAFDPAEGIAPWIIHIAGRVYVIAYQGPDNDGWLKTTIIQNDGVIIC